MSGVPGQAVSPASSDARPNVYRLKVVVLEATDLPKSGIRNKNTHQYYASLRINDEEKRTNVSGETKSPGWKDQQLLFEISTIPSQLIVGIYRSGRLMNSLVGKASIEVSPGALPRQTEVREYSVVPNGHIKLEIELAEQSYSNSDATRALEHTTQIVADRVQEPSISTIIATIIAKLETFSEIIKTVAELNNYSKLAVGILFGVHKMYKSHIDRDEKIRTLVQDIDAFYSFVLERANNINVAETWHQLYMDILRQTVECSYFIDRYAYDKYSKRLAKHTFSRVDDTITKYGVAFNRLKERFDRDTAVQTELVSTRVLALVETTDEKIDSIIDVLALNDMPYAGGASLGAKKKSCMDGTRTEILSDISRWIESCSSETQHAQIMLLHGGAGTGKSSIAHTIAQQYLSSANGHLGVSFAFDKNEADRSASKLLPTIARNLSGLPSIGADFKKALLVSNHSDRASLTTRDLEQQLNRLLIGPSAMISPLGPIVVIIDALDECVGPDRADLFDVLLSGLSQLPYNFRILITSRPDEDIMSRFQGAQGVTLMDMHTNVPEGSTIRDITAYICFRLRGSKVASAPDFEDNCVKLAILSQGLFQWAFLACEYILRTKAGQTSMEQMKQLFGLIDTNTTPHNSLLDSLYETILRQWIPLADARSLLRFKFVVGMVLAAYAPLSADTLQKLHRAYCPTELDGTNFDVTDILRYLGSLLGGVTSVDQLVAPLHTSFRDYLTDNTRSGAFYINLTEAHRNLGFSSLSVLCSELRFNICHFPSSYISNADFLRSYNWPEFPIASHVSYTSRSWARHLEDSSSTLEDIPSDIVKLMRGLLFEKLLFWLEVLSITQTTSVALDALRLIISLTQGIIDHVDLTEFTKDAVDFVDRLGPATSYSVPHIYLSSLAFAPLTSLVALRYRSSFPGIPRVDGLTATWPIMRKIIEASGIGDINVAISPDCTQVVVATEFIEETDVELWDLHTATSIYRLNARGQVHAVEFSSDGRSIGASTSENIIIWDVKTKKQQAASSGAFECTAFSPDLKRMIEAGKGIIRVWDPFTGEIVQEWNAYETRPVETSIHTLLWSPNGSYVAVAIKSGDHCHITVYRATSWSIACTIPAQSACRLAFHPCTTRIILAVFSENSSTLWDIEKACGTPLKIDGPAPTSIAFSQDGYRLALGVGWGDIEIWAFDPTGTPTCIASLQSHTNMISHLAFTPDGTQLVSVSQSGEIQVWAVPQIQTDISIRGGDHAERAERYTKPLGTLFFSPDGHRIWSGIRMGYPGNPFMMSWSTDTGEPLGRVQIREGSKWGSRIDVSANGTLSVFFNTKEMCMDIWSTTDGHGFTLKHSIKIDGELQYKVVSCSPRGDYVIGGCYCETGLWTWDVATGRLAEDQLVLDDDKVRFLCCSYSPNGAFVAAKSQDHKIHLWDTTTRRLVHRPLASNYTFVPSVTFSQDSRRIASGAGRTIRVWDVNTGELIGEPFRGHTFEVNSVQFSPDGTRVVSGSIDGTVRIWDVVTGQAIGRPIWPHSNRGGIHVVVYSPDGKQVASESGSGEVELWDVSLDTEILDASAHPPILFSRNPEHALKYDDQIPDRSTTKFREDGWMVSYVKGLDDSERLLFWVPGEHRKRLWLYRLQAIVGAGDSESYTNVDLSAACHGKEWAMCYQPGNDAS